MYTLSFQRLLSYTRKLRLIALLVGIYCFQMAALYGQTSSYEKAWAAIHNADVKTAMAEFENALKDENSKDAARLCLAMLYSNANREEKASQLMQNYLDENENPLPAIYALWQFEGLVGFPGFKTDHQVDFLNKLLKMPDHVLTRATAYNLWYHHFINRNDAEFFKMSEKLSGISDYQLVGPFDNVMNGGFDKNFGPLLHPEPEAEFESKYGAPVQWFTPKNQALDGYVFKEEHFESVSSIIYAQTFIELEDVSEEIMLKFSYSGSLKLWVNDQLLYSQAERRRSEIDYYTVKLKLNEGYNRILLQLGDYEEATTSFALRATGLDGKDIKLNVSKTNQPYSKTVSSFEFQPHSAHQAILEQYRRDPNDLNTVLLAKSHLRSFDLQSAEILFKKILEKHPKSYFALRELILLYDNAENQTAQNLYYGLFEKYYPHSKDILESEIEEAMDQKDLEEYTSLVSIYNENYYDAYKAIAFEMGVSIIEDDYQKILELSDEMYGDYPGEYDVFYLQYELQKNHFSDKDKAREILSKFMDEAYVLETIKMLANDYAAEGDLDRAIELYQELLKYTPSAHGVRRYIVNLLSRQKKYNEAIAVCMEILEDRPSDYLTIKDVAVLSKYIGDEKTALSYYQKVNAYFPFSFDVNEKIRDLQGDEKMLDLLEEVDVDQLIREFNSREKSDLKKSIDIVWESQTDIIYSSSARCFHQAYILRMNEESAIKNWQQVNLSVGTNFSLDLREAKTIKSNGEKISADRGSGSVVFTNLEIGDYIYLNYFETQTNGGKTSKFFSNSFTLNRSVPTYLIEYNLIVENGIELRDTVTNGDLKPIVNDLNGFKHYKWVRKNPAEIKEENFAPAFGDLVERVQVSTTHEWEEIVQWFSDLSSHQARSDNTIEKIAKDILDGNEMTTKEKFQKIYNFVCSTIQYSSIDFRQSGFIPIKASNVYHSRLGDCKDVSTLFVSIAREMGLKANLVLISTSDNAQNNVAIPALNFNHCIVRAYDGENTYLELTNPTLPYGHLYYYHENAPILEIPSIASQKDVKLDKLALNNGYESNIFRKSNVDVSEDGGLKIEKHTVKTGTHAARMTDDYFNLDKLAREEKLQDILAPYYVSQVKVDSVVFESLNPLTDSVIYNYHYSVAKEIVKIGSFNTLKIPFADIIVNLNTFVPGEREYSFDYSYYEDTNEYEESMMVVLPMGASFMEIPENIKLDFKTNHYELTFEQIDSRKIIINRTYSTEREKIEVSDFDEFKSFMTAINEAENTHLLYK